MFNKCSPRSIFCCLFTVCTNDTHILSRNCPPDVHPRTNFVAFLPRFLLPLSLQRNSSNFFSFFPPSSFFHTRAHTDRAYDRTSFLFFPFPSFYITKAVKGWKGGKNLFLQIRDYFNFSTIFRGRRRIFATSENSWKVGSVQFIALVNPPRALFTEDSRDKKPGWAQ